jgi:Tol biopolymer transport system component/uncharacterized protein YukE
VGSLAGLTLALSLLLLSPASGFPGVNGRIAFATNRDGDFEIYLMSGTGGSQANLTNSAGTSDTNPSFSADGTKVAFVRDGNVWRINTDGSALTQLTTTGGTDPAWSPDGTKIAFASAGDIWAVSSVDGSGPTNLTNHGAVDSAPAWSPDGARIAFTTDRAGNAEVYSMNAADGGSPTPLSSSSAADRDPSWSADGTKIAFVSERDGNAELYVMNADGGGQTRLTSDARTQSAPSWSPDGTKIAYAATDGANSDVYVIAAAGGSSTALTTGTAADGEPDWGVALASISPPTITGAPTGGTTLTASTGSWVSSSTITGYSYVWKRCDASGASCAAISGATSSTYRLTSSDVGSTVRVAVTATTADGSATAESAATAVVTAGPPVNVTAPAITGTASVGSLLFSTTGTWAGTTPFTFTRAWLRCNTSGDGCTATGATGSSYTVVAADSGSTIRVDLTATNTAGSATARSNATAVIASGVPANTVAPSISGTPRVGQSVSAFRGSWTGAAPITYTYQWQRCSSGGSGCGNITGAALSSYTPATADSGSTLRVIVTASNSAGSATATSPASVAVTLAAPSNTADPVITGSPRTGQVLTASPGTWTGSPTYQYQWQRCDRDGDDCVDIARATSSRYTVAAADLGKTLIVVVTATNSVGSEEAESEPTEVVTAGGSASATAPDNTVVPRVTGIAALGQRLTATEGTWRGAAPITYSLQWERCNRQGDDCEEIDRATRSIYTLVKADVGFRLRVVVTAENDEGSDSATSALTSVVAAQAPAVVKTKTIKGTKKGERVVGTPGPDRILPGAGADTVLAKAGNDRIEAVDRARDVIDCGPGNDSVAADRVDVVRNCEKVTRTKPQPKRKPKVR